MFFIAFIILFYNFFGNVKSFLDRLEGPIEKLVKIKFEKKYS